MVAATRVSLAQFLAMEETKPYLELIDGEVVPKAMPTDVHGFLVAKLISRLDRYLEESPEGRVGTEVRHLARGEERVYLPDVSVYLGRRPFVARGVVEVPPDFAIEVLSPDDQAGRVLERAAFYMRTGTSLLWIVDADLETVTVYTPGASPKAVRSPAILDAQPLLRAFTLDLGTLFAAVKDSPAP